jgi:hypothetical protein
MGTSIAMLERHYSHLEVLHRAEALAGKAEYRAKKGKSGETRIIELNDDLGDLTSRDSTAVKTADRSAKSQI